MKNWDTNVTLQSSRKEGPKWQLWLHRPPPPPKDTWGPWQCRVNHDHLCSSCTQRELIWERVSGKLNIRKKLHEGLDVNCITYWLYPKAGFYSHWFDTPCWYAFSEIPVYGRVTWSATITPEHLKWPPLPFVRNVHPSLSGSWPPSLLSPEGADSESNPPRTRPTKQHSHRGWTRSRF